VHTYAVSGTYTVVLWVGDGINYSQAAKTVDITTAGKVRKHLPKRSAASNPASLKVSP
jgi:hypothetical protein